MSLGTTYSPQSPWEGLQVKNFDQCLHIVMVIVKLAEVSRGIFFLDREGVTWEDLSMEEFVMGEEYFHEGVRDFLALFKKKMKK